MSWRFVNAAVRGTSHESGDVPCQDDCFVEAVGFGNEEILLAVASDGAGSASSSEEGSGLVCETLPRAVETWLRDGGTVTALTREVVEQWIGGIRAAIESRAAQKALALRDFACTLVAAIVSVDAAAFFQIGDGAIVAGRAGDYDVIFWPDGGEYANMTYFTTDGDWPLHLHFVVHTVDFDEIALMTDGLQRLALQFENRAVHIPFFAPMFRALGSAGAGFAAGLEPPLVAFLSSDAVNARTDDDKSLVLATRPAGGAHGLV